MRTKQKFGAAAEIQSRSKNNLGTRLSLFIIFGGGALATKIGFGTEFQSLTWVRDYSFSGLAPLTARR